MRVAGRNTNVTMAIVFMVLLSWAARRAMYLESSAIWRPTLLSRWAMRLKACGEKVMVSIDGGVQSLQSASGIKGRVARGNSRR